MIVVVARVRTDAERRDALLRVTLPSVAASRNDPGCIGYRLYEDLETPNDFVIIEEWESQEALLAHFATPHIATFMREMPPLLTAPPDVQFHTVASTATLADVARSPGP